MWLSSSLLVSTASPWPSSACRPRDVTAMVPVRLTTKARSSLPSTVCSRVRVMRAGDSVPARRCRSGRIWDAMRASNGTPRGLDLGLEHRASVVLAQHREPLVFRKIFRRKTQRRKIALICEESPYRKTRLRDILVCNCRLHYHVYFHVVSASRPIDRSKARDIGQGESRRVIRSGDSGCHAITMG